MNLALFLVKPGGIIENFAWHHHAHTFDLYPKAITLMENRTFSK